MAVVGQLYFTFIIISKYKIRQYTCEDGNFYICRECEELGYLSLVTTVWTTEFGSRAQAKDFSFSLCIQTSSEVHPACYPMCTGVFSRG
jgi:hypothetical protein